MLLNGVYQRLAQTLSIMIKLGFDLNFYFVSLSLISIIGLIMFSLKLELYSSCRKIKIRGESEIVDFQNRE